MATSHGRGRRRRGSIFQQLRAEIVAENKPTKIKLNSQRFFLESQKDSDSYIKIEVSTDKWNKGDTDLKLADCYRSINWHFGKPGDKRAIAKITKVKQAVDKIYNYLTQEME